MFGPAYFYFPRAVGEAVPRAPCIGIINGDVPATLKAYVFLRHGFFMYE